jgi:hypothetical protein
MINDNFSTAHANIHKALSNGYKLTNEDVSNFKKAYSIAQSSEPIRIEFLQSQSTSSAENLISAVCQIVKEKMDRLNTFKISDAENFEIIEKIEVLARGMPDKFET